MAKIKGLFNVVEKKEKKRKQREEKIKKLGGYTPDLCRDPKGRFEGNDDYGRIWFGYDFGGHGNEKQVEKYIIKTTMNRWFLQAAISEGAWQTIHTVENAKPLKDRKHIVEIEFENKKRFRMYRILTFKGSGKKIYWFKMMEKLIN
jgi:hypothetical protein